VTGAVPKDMRMKCNAEILYVESDPKIFEERFARCRHLLYFLAVRILGSEGSSGCCLYGDNEAYALGISDWFLRTR
jgi:hypothetical protein